MKKVFIALAVAAAAMFSLPAAADLVYDSAPGSFTGTAYVQPAPEMIPDLVAVAVAEELGDIGSGSSNELAQLVTDNPGSSSPGARTSRMHSASGLADDYEGLIALETAFAAFEVGWRDSAQA